MVEIRMPHTLERASAAERIRAAAAKLELSTPDAAGSASTEFSGQLSKETPFGPVLASWEALEVEVVVRIEQKPAFLPQSTITRLLEDGLRDALAP